MKHIQDNLNNVSNQTFDMAIITDSKGKQKGKILVRYTNSQVGYNNETGIIFYHNNIEINYETTIKGSTYDQGSVYKILKSNGCKVLDWHKKPYYDYSDKRKNGSYPEGNNIDGISSCKDQKYIKVGNSIFTIHWV